MSVSEDDTQSLDGAPPTGDDNDSGAQSATGSSAQPDDGRAARVPLVAVLGGGSWATTVASIVARSAPTVLWARSPDVVADVGSRSRNSRYLGDTPLQIGDRVAIGYLRPPPWGPGLGRDGGHGQKKRSRTSKS